MNTYHHGDLKNALIRAGIEILASEGVRGLSLRKVAKQAGVSHSAPYAHFADKQALIAAISTEGHARIYAAISEIMTRYADDPLGQLVATARAYLDFGMSEPDHFRITFSGVVEQERDYLALVEMTRKNFKLIREIATRCREASILGPGSDDLLAVSLWGAVHGLVSLIQQDQVSSRVIDYTTPDELLLFTLDQLTKIDLDPQNLSNAK
jgi:AcrR family transcriptional regulator